MTDNYHKTDDAKIDKIIADNFLKRTINNEKWVNVISTLVDNFNEIKECKVKLIWETDSEFRRLKIGEFVHYNFDFYETAMEAMISGSPKGWYAYKEIEWIDFPRQAISYENIETGIATEQNLKLIEELFHKIGIFETRIDEQNLRIYAYQ